MFSTGVNILIIIFIIWLAMSSRGCDTENYQISPNDPAVLTGRGLCHLTHTGEMGYLARPDNLAIY